MIGDTDPLDMGLLELRVICPLRDVELTLMNPETAPELTVGNLLAAAAVVEVNDSPVFSSGEYENVGS